MEVYGLQKLTLLDYPGKTACTIFTGGCNLRCPFCHNALLVTQVQELEAYDETYVLDFLKKRQHILDGVAVTGGEPLLHRDIRDLLFKIKTLGYAVKLDTNGCFPKRLKELVDEGLVDHVAVDIKNCRERYGETVGVNDFDIRPVEETVDFLMQNGISYEFRTTVVEEFHDEAAIRKLAQWIWGAENYYLQQFKDSGNLIKAGLHAVSEKTLRQMLEAASPYVKNCGVRGVEL